ncbi:MAG: hypothetical protein B2I17_08890 [Thermoplasmatales archaeon B_DKE]|nr:MAG: hypothetical protein B2I17_08890 [Thermoplasmatales archaeon B_DKE]
MTSDNEEHLLSEILKWIKIIGAKDVKSVLMNALDTDQKLQIYSLSDGNRGSVEIGKASGTSDRTVRRYWEKWKTLGIVESTKVKGGERYYASFDPDNFGLNLSRSRSNEQSKGGGND